MKHFSLISFALAFMVVFASCNERLFWPDDEDGFLNQELVIKNADGTLMKTKNKLAIGNKKSYPIGSAFCGGSISDPTKGSSHRYHCYEEHFTEGPNWLEVNIMVMIRGFCYRGTKYTEPGQMVDFIKLELDPSLGYGERLIIPMNQGKYEGGCDLVKDVKINSLNCSSYKEDHWTVNEDGKIDIRILMKDGTKIAILYAGAIPPDDYV